MNNTSKNNDKNNLNNISIKDMFEENYFLKKSKPLNLLERLYFIEIIKGLFVTIKHFLYNLFNYSKLPTIDYPYKKRKIHLHIRGRHRLTKRPDGTLRCVACYLCATACPAKCIHIEAGEYTDGNINEKYPIRYDIDMLRCVFCGMCVEACPCDAIRMDTGIYDLSNYSRESLIFNKEMLSSDFPPVNTRGEYFDADQYHNNLNTSTEVKNDD